MAVHLGLGPLMLTAIHTEKWEWHAVELSAEGAIMKRLHRVGHTAIALPPNGEDEGTKVLIFGGQDAQDHRHNSIDVLTIMTPSG